MDHTFRAGSLRADHRRRAGVVVASAITVAALAAATGSATASAPPESATTGSAAPVDCGTTDDVTLTVGLFGTFGFKENGLYDQYQQACPNVTIQEDVVEQSADYWTRLQTRLASGSGLADVQAIEIGFVADVVANHADQFVNFADRARVAGSAGRVLRLEVGAGELGGRLDDRRPRDRHRPAGDLLPPGSPRRGRRRVRPGQARRCVVDVGRLHRLRPDLRGLGDQARRLALRRHRGEHLLGGRLPGRICLHHARRHARPGEQPRRAGRMGVRHPGGAGRHHRRPAAVHRRLEQGVLERRVRGDRLPELDDGLHPGPGRAGLRRQVEHRPGAARWRSQLGRLVARRARRRPERRRRRRPRRVDVGRAAAGGDVDVGGAGRPLPVQLRRRRRAGGARTRRTRTSATRRSARSSAASPRRWRSCRSGSTTRRSSKPSRRS